MLLLQPPASKLQTERVGPSSVLARARDFLPQMAAANDVLAAASAEGVAEDIISIEKVVPTTESSSSSSDSSDDSEDESTGEDDEPNATSGPSEIAMDVMLFANKDEDNDDESDDDDDEDVPTAWRAEGDKEKTERSPSKKSKIEEL